MLSGFELYPRWVPLTYCPVNSHLSYSSHVISAWFFRLWAQLNNSQLGTQSCLDTSKDDRWKWWLEREQIHFHERIHCFFTASVDGKLMQSIYMFVNLFVISVNVLSLNVS